MNQYEINDHLKREIEREVMIKSTTRNAQLTRRKRMAEARHKIEDLKELKRVEDEYLLDYEGL